MLRSDIHATNCPRRIVLRRIVRATNCRRRIVRATNCRRRIVRPPSITIDIGELFSLGRSIYRRSRKKLLYQSRIKPHLLYTIP